MSDAGKSLSTRVARLEAERQIRAALSEYMYICDRLDWDTDLAALGALFTKDAVWRGRGDRYARDFGERKGRKAIVDWLGTFCTDPPHFAMNAHFLSSERIDVADDKTARGRWLMLQTPTFHDGQSLLMAAELHVTFAHEDDAWRISVFETTNLYTRAVGDWAQNAQVPAPSATT
ncbi:nuclear transport factor 2 family protein [Roseobacter sp. MH60115]|uniref:nuclear transport factor 2 family protein n=1 Tax=Roseobacter sp. MH60115 TaxID=2785324 RepID=UPI0018A2BB66|nr:nuclear transport factor 2 family protein [Roseobacter sp. MH60115]